MQGNNTGPVTVGPAAANLSVVRWQDMRVKSDKAKDLPNEAKDTATTVGIWHPVYDHRLAIKHLYFMRQLPPDVAANKVSGCGARQHRDQAVRSDCLPATLRRCSQAVANGSQAAYDKHQSCLISDFDGVCHLTVQLRKPPAHTLPMDPASLTSEPVRMGIKRHSRCSSRNW